MHTEFYELSGLTGKHWNCKLSLNPRIDQRNHSAICFYLHDEVKLVASLVTHLWVHPTITFMIQPCSCYICVDIKAFVTFDCSLTSI